MSLTKKYYAYLIELKAMESYLNVLVIPTVHIFDNSSLITLFSQQTIIILVP